MDEKQLQALANELAKNLKTPEDLSQFDRLLKKISVEAALNAEMSHHLGYDKPLKSLMASMCLISANRLKNSPCAKQSKNIVQKPIWPTWIILMLLKH